MTSSTEPPPAEGDGRRPATPPANAQQGSHVPPVQSGEGGWAPAGWIGRPHGLDGSVHVSDARGRLLTLGAAVRVGARERSIERRAGTDEHPILRLGGVHDQDGAEALRGMEIAVAVARLPQLPDGEFWAHQLEGCEVRDGDVEVGTVSRLIELPSCEALEVHRAGGRQPLLVPMVSDALRGVDVERRLIDVDLVFLGEEP